MARGFFHGLAVAALTTLLLPVDVALAGEEIWVVKPGDMLGTISRRFGVSVSAIKAWNHLDSDRIRVGQELVIKRTSDGDGPRRDDAPPRADGPTYEVRRGDTLGRIARRAQTTVDEIARWNPGLDPDRIRVGEELRLPEERSRLEHVVRHGESLRDIAERYEVEPRELRLWNDLRGTLKAGEALVLFSDAPPSRSESIGLPYRGSLREPSRLLPHPGYVIRDPARAYGTEETVNWLYEAFDAVEAKLGRGPRVRVHDVSLPSGGFMRGHASHQSGRDVDLSLYRTRCKNRICPFSRLEPSEMDVERQWELLKHMLERRRAEVIFLDYALQKPLYERAKREGATLHQLREWFQYPRGRDNPKGVIRHYRNHRDHAHVRFVCPKTDEECVPK